MSLQASCSSFLTMSSLLRSSTHRFMWSRIRCLRTKADAEENRENLPGELNKERTKSRTTATLDPEIEQMFEDGVHYTGHPGIRRIGCVSLPAYLDLAAKRAISRHLNQQFRKDALRMFRRVYHLELPLEKEDMTAKKRLVVERVIGNEPHVDFQMMTEAEQEYFLAKRQKKIDHLVSTVNTTWKDIEYDNYAAHVYLGARLAPNYATLLRIFYEIKKIDPTFAPKSMFDFGSGVGTAMFAANETWPNTISEHFNVDISKHMNELSTFLLRGGQDNMPMLYNGVYHREYLPLSSEIKYDLVVAANTLMELPSRSARVQSIESLWHKTADLLVIAETGSRHGFAAVLEARNLVLEMSGYDVTKSYYNRPVGQTHVENYDPNNAPTAHVLAPCPHEYSCPRMDTGGPILCNCIVTYRKLDIGQRPVDFDKEVFSYVVLRKGGKRQGDHPNWPRINQPVLKRAGHIHCRMCCPDGSQRSLIVSKASSEKHVYKCARFSRWGDLMPATVFEDEKPLSYWDKMKARASEQKARQETASDSDSDFSDDEKEFK